MIFLAIVIVFQSDTLRWSAGRYTRKEFVVYKSAGSAMADFIYGDRSLLVRSDPAFPISGFMRNMLNDHWIHKGIEKQAGAFLSGGVTNQTIWQHPVLPVFRHGNFFLFGNKRIYFLRSTFSPGNGSCMTLDYLVIGGDVRNDLNEILGIFDPGFIILDSSLKKWRCKRLMEAASRMKIPVFSVPDSGAFFVYL